VSRPSRFSYESFEAEDKTPALNEFVSASLLGFASTAMVMPFEVGKTLLQIQYVPRDELGNVQEHAAVDEYPETEDDVELMFSEATQQAGAPYEPVSDIPRPRDAQGYLVSRSVYDASTKPEWVLPEIVTGGVWDMIKSLARFPNEGYLALWKGQLTTFMIDSLSTTIQPVLQSILSSGFLPSDLLPTLPLIHSPHPGLPLVVATASHAITGILLSPLDLVRTRLIAQSSMPAHRKYRGPLHALRTIFNEEGGALSAYFHPTLFIPALLDSTIRPLLHIAAPLVIERSLGISRSDSPLAYGLAELALGVTSLLVTLPIETVRRRLQVQARQTVVQGSRGKLRTCVETRPAPYLGVVHTVYCILTEETGRVPMKGKTVATGSGIRQLYKGLSMGIGAKYVFAYSLSHRKWLTYKLFPASSCSCFSWPLGKTETKVGRRCD
jgi:fusion and transport protein UGO1